MFHKSIIDHELTIDRNYLHNYLMLIYVDNTQGYHKFGRFYLC